MKHYYLDLTLNGIEHREYSVFSLSEGTRLFHTIIDNLKGDGDIYYLKDGELYYEDDYYRSEEPNITYYKDILCYKSNE